MQVGGLIEELTAVQKWVPTRAEHEKLGDVTQQLVTRRELDEYTEAEYNSVE